MPPELKTYKVTFVLNGKLMWEWVTAPSIPNVYLIIQGRYPGATGLSVWEA